MVGTAKTTVQMPRVYVVSADQIYLFCRSTKDDNKVHQGDNPVVPGFYLDFLVKHHFDTQARIRNPAMKFTGLDAKFRSIVLKDEPFYIKEEETYNQNDATLTYRMSIIKPNTVMPDGTTADVEAVEGSVKYGITAPNPQTAKLNSKMLPYSKPGKSYTLQDEVMENVKHSLGNVQRDKAATIVSATSHALQTDKESYDVLFNETLLKDRYPFFAKHDLIAYAGLENLATGEEFVIHNKHGESKMGMHPAYVRGVNIAGMPIFDLTCTIMFQEKKIQ
jgi:hypothetical protein